MADGPQFPLEALEQALESTDQDPAASAILATTLARWRRAAGDRDAAAELLTRALKADPELRGAWRSLAHLRLDGGDVRGAIEALDREIRVTRHPREAAALYRTRGRWLEAHFGDKEGARQCFEAAAKAAPDDAASLRALESSALSRGDVAGLIAALEAQVAAFKSPDVVAPILRELASLEARAGGDVHLAADCLIAALEASGAHPLLASDLVRVAERSGDASLLLGALELEASTLPRRHRASVLLRAAQILQQSGESAAAVEIVRTAAMLQPDNVSVWRYLVELARQNEDHATVMWALARRIDATRDDDEPHARAELLYQLGRWALFRAHRPQEGLAALRRAIDLDPRHLPALEDAARYLTAKGLWAQLLELLRTHDRTSAKAGFDDRHRASALLRTGAVLEDQLNEPESALNMYEDALRLVPGFRPARDRIERTLHRLDRRDDLARFYERELERAKSAGRKAHVGKLLALLQRAEGRVEEAGAQLQALADQPETREFGTRSLVQLYRDAGQWEPFIDATRGYIEQCQDPAEKVELQHAVATALAKTGRQDDAVAALRAALALEPDHRPSRHALEELARERGDAATLAEMLPAQGDNEDAFERIRLRMRSGVPAQELAAELAELLQRAPEHVEALTMAEHLAEKLGNSERHAELMDARVAAAFGSHTRALLLTRRAAARLEAGDAEPAAVELRRALELWPQLSAARSLLSQALAVQGKTDDLRAVAEASLAVERGRSNRRRLARHLAATSSDPAIAIPYLTALAEADPSDYVSQWRLARACRRGRRYGAEAAATLAMAEALEERGETPPEVLRALRFRAARSHEAAGNLSAADQSYRAILSSSPDDTMATAGRARIQARRRSGSRLDDADALERAAEEALDATTAAGILTVAADRHEGAGRVDQSLALLDEALGRCGDFLPALAAKARLLAQRGTDQDHTTAIETYRSIAESAKGPRTRIWALCEAGTLALRGLEKPNGALAWQTFGRALELDPLCAPAFRGLQQTLDRIGSKGAPPLAATFHRRLDGLVERDELNAEALRDLAGLAQVTDGAACAVELLERGAPTVRGDPGVRADLAQGYARLGRWPEVVRELESAMAYEMSPERTAALQFFLGDAQERAGDPAAAIDAYLAAGQAGFHPEESLRRAAHTAKGLGDRDRLRQALQSLSTLDRGTARIDAHRELAELAGADEAKAAVAHLRAYLRSRPADVAAHLELSSLLRVQGKATQSRAAVLAAISHCRPRLRGANGARLDIDAVASISRLFAALQDDDAYYVSAAVLETVAPDRLEPQQRCGRLVTDPWPLPLPHAGSALDLVIGGLSSQPAFNILRHGAALLHGVDELGGPEEFVAERVLAAESGTMIVARSLARALGLPPPTAVVDPGLKEAATAQLRPTPHLRLSRRVHTNPFAPNSRDAIGRALMRLTVGGDSLLHPESSDQLNDVLAGLCKGVGIDASTVAQKNGGLVSAVAEAVGQTDDLEPLERAARRLADRGYEPAALRDYLIRIEDRAGAICAADPRATLEAIPQVAALPARALDLIRFLLADEYLGPRRALGYHNVGYHRPQGDA